MDSDGSPASSDDRANEEWVRVLRAPGSEGDAARAELRQRLLRGLTRALSGRPVDDATLEDFAQASLLRVLERLSQFRGESRFTTWAIAVAVRVGLSELRRAHWREVSLEEVAPDADRLGLGTYHDGTATAERALAQRRVLEVLDRAAKNELTSKQRQLIVCELRGMPQEEIAHKLGTSRNALYKLGHDARRALLRALTDAGLRAEDIRWAFET